MEIKKIITFYVDNGVRLKLKEKSIPIQNLL